MQQTSREQALDLEPGSRGRGGGRKNRDGIEEAPKVPTLKQACPRLLRLYRQAQEHMTEYKEALTKICEANHANAGDVNRLIKASFKGNFEDVRRHVEQQQIIFEGVGEVSDAHEK
jgi:hypothetical protein